MTLNEIRSKYLAFFKEREHVVIPSAPVVPENDPTTLFTGSGMQPLVPYLLGKDHPEGKRLVNSQKSFRAMDIEEVGDNRHTTFFEMLGNWSLGDYFKKEQLTWFFEFLTKEVGLDPRKLYVTVFIGDEKSKVPRDTESAEVWKKIFAGVGIDAKDVLIGSEEEGYEKGMQGGRIFFYDAKKNWWSRAGVPENMPPGEPGGPDSEVFYDFGSTDSPQAVHHDPKFGKYCHPNCDCGRFLEIGNSVFMQYIKKEDGSFGLLPKQNVDFGGGLERISAASNGNPDVFRTDVFEESILLVEKFSGKSYGEAQYTRSFRIILDHIRAATFMIADGVRPSNTDRGYVLRRLLRRAVQHANKLGIMEDASDDTILVRCATLFTEEYSESYPELNDESVWSAIKDEIAKEEKHFQQTLQKGLREFEKIISVRGRTSDISGEEAFLLFTSYGFPFEMTEELAKARGFAIDTNSFKDFMKKHQELSRSGSEQKFKGGLADHSEKTTRLHTAHHLLLKALQIVLGPHVKQRGSNITQERLRIDFAHGEKMTKLEIAEVERIVNEKIEEGLPVTRSILPKEKAESLGAEHEFGAKYPDMVSVYSVGPKTATLEDPQFGKAFSIEFCGGPHVENTIQIADGLDPSTPFDKAQGKSPGAKFSILKEEATAAGVRRIKAVLY